MKNGSILIVDDDPQLRRALRLTLKAHGFETRESASGAEALEEVRAGEPDLILRDLNMPGIDGFETCRTLRLGYETPIIIVSVRNAEQEKVAALDAGADDYVTKPFGTPELLARIRAALRRSPGYQPGVVANYSSEGLEIDFERRRAKMGGAMVRFTPKQLDVLSYLVARAGKPISHRELLRAVWGPGYGDEVEYLRVFINQLRKKIEPDPAKPRYLLTEPWVGYSFAEPEKP
jgi:two-component system KDP operon response regulator KdpE